MPDIRIKNTMYTTKTIELPEGRTLTLGPRETKPIDEEDFASEGVQKALRDGEVMVFAEE